MVMDYIGAVLLIVFAEMGDKTQFLAMAFATKYPVKKILLGIAIGAFLNHGLAMVLGRALMQLMPGELISFIAGLMFVFFAFQSLAVDDEDVEEQAVKFGPVLTVALAFFLGELGDKTQLAALGLSVDSTYMLAALMGTVTGMLITSSLGIFIGLKLGKNIPEDKLKISAFGIFMLFGLQKLYNAYFNRFALIYLAVALVVIAFISVYFVLRFHKRYQLLAESAFRRQAENLKQTREKIEFQVVSLCKGAENCGVCDGSQCLVGYMKQLLRSAEQPITELESVEIGDLKNKDFSHEEAKEILHILMDYYKLYPDEFEANTALKGVRHAAEQILLGKMISCEHFQAYTIEIEHHI